MKKFLLYFSATVLSFGIWFFVGTQTLPFVGWILGADLEEGGLLLGLMGLSGLCGGILLFALLSWFARKKAWFKEKKKFAFLPVLLPFSVCGALGLYFIVRYGYGYWIGDYYDGDGAVYNKFGKKVVSTDGRGVRIRHNIIYLYDSEGGTGSVYNAQSKSYPLTDTNLKYAGEIFEQNGQFGIALKGNGLIGVEPIYEELDFLDNGLIKARRNGKYGILDPLGLAPLLDPLGLAPLRVSYLYEQECFSCDFDEIRVISSSYLEGDDAFISATKNGEATIYLLKEDCGYTFAEILFTTPYDVRKVCEEVGGDYRFIARDDDSAFIIDGNGEALTSTYQYESINYDPDSKTYRGWSDYDNEWENITLSE